jgi:peptidoglycan/xylan/chitin deacetylase (PgdA/CDA1 family)
VSAVSVEENQLSSRVENLAVFPQPTRDRVTVRLHLTERTGLVLAVYNIRGQAVAVEKEQHSAGVFQTGFNLRRQPAGEQYDSPGPTAGPKILSSPKTLAGSKTGYYTAYVPTRDTAANVQIVLYTGIGGGGNSGTAPACSLATWQGAKTSAYCYTVDDNLASQVSIICPKLESYGYRATIYLVAGRICAQNDQWCSGIKWSVWRGLSAKGHEIGNHSLSHWFPNPAVDSLNKEIDGAWKLLKDSIGIAPLTFAYPGSSREGTVQYIATLDSLVFLHHLDFRQGNDRDGIITNRVYTNYGTGCDTDMNGDIDRIIAHASGGWPGYAPTNWLIGLQHGIGEGYCPTSQAAFNAHIDYVHSKDSLLWVGTYADIFRYEKQKKAAVLTMTQYTANSATFTATCPLDAAIYNVPLTVVLIPAVQPASATAYRQGSASAVDVKVKGRKILATVAPGSAPVRVIWQ